MGDSTSGVGETRQTPVLVKPYSAGLTTNLLVTTDRRAYHIPRVSTWVSALSSMPWTFPLAELLALRPNSARLYPAILVVGSCAPWNAQGARLLRRGWTRRKPLGSGASPISRRRVNPA